MSKSGGQSAYQRQAMQSQLSALAAYQNSMNAAYQSALGGLGQVHYMQQQAQLHSATVVTPIGLDVYPWETAAFTQVDVVSTPYERPYVAPIVEETKRWRFDPPHWKDLSVLLLFGAMIAGGIWLVL